MRVVRILFAATVTGSCLLFECHKFAPRLPDFSFLQDIVAAKSTARGNSRERERGGERRAEREGVWRGA